MKKTLQDQYLSIKEGKGHKGVFLTEAKRQFPNIVRNAATFEEAVASLQTKNIITENIVGLTAVNSPFSPSKKESYELAYEAFLAEAKKKENEDEKVKAEEKKPSKKVEEDYSHAYDQKDNKDIDNLIFDQVMTGYYAELKDPKNADKTMQELKDIVMKNLAKDSIFYTKDGQFGEKGLGYTTEAPGLGTPKEAKGKYKASGYGDLNESIQPINEEESKLRKVIREIINEEIEEAYQLVNINLKAPKKDREERDPSDKYLTFDKDFEKDQRRKGNIIVKDGDRIFITKVLHANLGPKAGNSDLRKYLMDRANLEPAVLGGQQVWKIKGAEINSKGNISVKVIKFVPVEKSSLKESVEKELAAINKEAEHEIISSKLEKVQSLIDKKQSQLTKLDEDEDMKDLTDKKKVKEIEKDIKSLEKAKAKLEKMMGKKGGKAKKEVIDEIDDENEYEREEMAAKYVKDANNRQDAGQKISSILSNYPNLSLNNRHKLEDELEDRSENYDLAVRGITPKLDDLDGNDLNQEDIESIIDTYNAKSKPWMKLESDELEILKLDLIGKYLGTDNE
jgi:hypothetical protein